MWPLSSETMCITSTPGKLSLKLNFIPYTVTLGQGLFQRDPKQSRAYRLLTALGSLCKAEMAYSDCSYHWFYSVTHSLCTTQALSSRCAVTLTQTQLPSRYTCQNATKEYVGKMHSFIIYRIRNNKCSNLDKGSTCGISFFNSPTMKCLCYKLKALSVNTICKNLHLLLPQVVLEELFTFDQLGSTNTVCVHVCLCVYVAMVFLVGEAWSPGQRTATCKTIHCARLNTDANLPIPSQTEKDTSTYH